MSSSLPLAASWRSVFLPLLLLISVSFHLKAQSRTVGTIQGTVRTADGQPAEFINVVLEQSQRGAVTDANGRFEIRNVKPGTHTLVVSYVGLEAQQLTAEVVAGETTQLPEITLQETSQRLKEVIVTGDQTNTNKFAEPETDYVARMPLANLENPQVYSVISQELMQEQQITDIQGAIQNAPGVNSVVEGVGSGGVGLNVNLRGFSTGIALRNGMATNYVTLSDPVNLERIEVIKGPSATLFGSALISYGGLINRVTKQPFERFRGEVGYSTGSFGLSRLTLDVNTPLNDSKTALFRVNAVKHNENSFQDYGRQRTWALSPNFTYQASDRLTLNVEAELFQTRRPSAYFGISPGVTATNFDDLSYDFQYSYSSDQMQSQAQVFNVFARATYQLSDQWVSQTNFSSGHTDNEANYLFLTFLDNSQVRRMPMHIVSNFNSTQLQQNFIGTFHLGPLKNRLLVGVDYYELRTADRRTRFVYDTVSFANPQRDINWEGYQNQLGSTPPFFQYKRDSRTYSAYVSEVLNLTNQLLVMASARIDHFANKSESFEQTAVSPKLGLVYQVVPEQVSLFANYMDGFQNVAPDNTDPANTIAYKPEHATQWEGGVKTNLFSERVSATVSYYDITVRNIVRTVPNNDNIGGFNQVQDGTKNSKGVEVELIASPVRGWNVVAGYGYNDSQYTKASEDVQGHRPYSTPEHALNFWTSYQFPQGTLEGLGLGFGGNSVSEAFLDDANTFTIPAYTVLNATVFYNRPQYRIGVKLNNLGNEAYWTSSYWAMPQKTRHAVVSFAYKF
ncbi:TonB-dependent siderophore receptor [Catalinimonas alkaloidigena]|uniref:TonB-dependent siderophore receptor n=1 Tax=Catalinimonas alkaloidigena TaxID=1075417 RepID=A0A1G9VGI3_9BACT|nr:TonB-dependent receptor [Catalinimonas alkaloidigena]SDM71157.1 TonB-dependent siderophore receptor [Catalinimonas alkaloidigena]